MLTLGLDGDRHALDRAGAGLCDDRRCWRRCWSCSAGCSRAFPPASSSAACRSISSEIATPGHKGFYVSWQSGSQQVAVIFVALLGVVLSIDLPPEDMAHWGWRIPFLVGCLIIPLLFMLRRSLQETGGLRASAARIRRRARSSCVARAELAARDDRHAAGDDDHGVVLFHHRLYADLRHAKCCNSATSTRWS